MMQFYIRDYKNLSEIFSIILSRLWKFTYLGGPGTHLWPIRSLKWVWLMCRKMLNHGWPPSTTWCGKDSKNWWNCCGYEPRRVSGTYSVSQEYGPDNWWQLPSILCTYTPFSPLKQQKKRYRAVQHLQMADGSWTAQVRAAMWPANWVSLAALQTSLATWQWTWVSIRFRIGDYIWNRYYGISLGDRHYDYGIPYIHPYNSIDTTIRWNHIVNDVYNNDRDNGWDGRGWSWTGTR